jgi:predicted HAD superfamily Cof-like phosphohydrolase
VSAAEGSFAAKVREFHAAFGLAIASTPDPRPEAWRLRIALLREEFDEYVQAAEAGDLVGVADALADMVYVIYGTATEYGVPLDDVLAEVHRSNMSKLGTDGAPVRREDGKVLKGPAYSPPDIAGVLHRPS